MGDVGKQIARNHSLHALHKDILGGRVEGRDISIELTHCEGPSAIAYPTIERGTAIDGHQVAFCQDGFLIRNAVHDDVINGSTDGARKSFVPLEGGIGTGIANGLLSHRIQLEGRYARRRSSADFLQCFANNFAGGLHGV